MHPSYLSYWTSGFSLPSPFLTQSWSLQFLCCQNPVRSVDLHTRSQAFWRCVLFAGILRDLSGPCTSFRCCSREEIPDLKWTRRHSLLVSHRHVWRCRVSYMKSDFPGYQILSGRRKTKGIPLTTISKRPSRKSSHLWEWMQCGDPPPEYQPHRATSLPGSWGWPSSHLQALIYPSCPTQMFKKIPQGGGHCSTVD